MEFNTRDGDEIRTIKTAPLEYLPLEALLFRMKGEDRRDFLGQCPTENPIEIAWHIMTANKGLGYLVWISGRPVGAFGVLEVHRGNWSLWAIGADHPEVAMLMLGPLFEDVLPHIRSHGGWRIECKSRADRPGMRERMALLGFRPEGLLRRFGTDRSNYLTFAYQLEDEESVPVSVPTSEVLQAAPAA